MYVHMYVYEVYVWVYLFLGAAADFPELTLFSREKKFVPPFNRRGTISMNEWIKYVNALQLKIFVWMHIFCVYAY